jgi:hypothetical protein
MLHYLELLTLEALIFTIFCPFIILDVCFIIVITLSMDLKHVVMLAGVCT